MLKFVHAWKEEKGKQRTILQCLKDFEVADSGPLSPLFFEQKWKGHHKPL